MVQMERCEQILQQGGMIVLQAGRAHIYRTQDARRSLVGTLDKASVDDLLEKGAVHVANDEAPVRLVWTGAQSARPRAFAGRASPPKAGARLAPVRCALEHILRAEPEAARQAYLLSAASRFQRDTEAYQRGQAVTMNWSFVPRGKMRAGSGRDGLSERSLNAGRALGQLAKALGPDDMVLVEGILVSQVSMTRLMARFNLERAQVAPEGLRVLSCLAKAYDLRMACT